MNIAIIMSKDRLEQEHAMLNRLVVGLLNEGHQVIRVVPTSPTEDLPRYEKDVSLATRICVPMPASWMLRKRRRDEIISSFEKANVEMIVAFGRDALQVALEVLPHLDVKVLSEVISMRDATCSKPSSPVWRWLAATPSLEHVIAKRVGDERVAFVPLGVTSTKHPNNFDTLKRRCICILEAAREQKTTRSIMEAIADIPDIHIFIELIGKKQHRVWRHIRELNMLDRVTFLRDVGELRTLITQTDLVIVPSKSMSLRSVLLEAMLCGVPIVATNIEGFDMLVDEETALIAKNNWITPIQRLLSDPDFAEKLGATGSSLISSNYGSAAQIDAFGAAFSLI